ncbi:MAG: rhamnulokinase [Candidatus Sumerlaeota bacterium]
MGIDLGASSGRAILGCIRQGKLELEEIHRFKNGPVMMSGINYWDFPGLWNNIIEGLRIAADRTGGRLAGIGVDTWGVDFGLIGKDGQLLGNPVCHRDALAERGLKRALDKFTPAEFYKIIGHAPAHVSTMAQLTEMAATPLRMRLENAEAVLLMPDLIRFLLCGDMRVEHTALGSTQLADISTAKWSDEILKAFDIPKNIMPPIAQTGEEAGTLRPELAKISGLNKVPVYAAPGHDTAAAGAAVPYTDEESAFCIIGTWSILGTHVQAPVNNQAAADKGFLNEFGFGSILFVHNLLGLYLFENLYRQLNRKEKVSYAQMVKMAKEARPFQYFINPQSPRFMMTDDPAAEVRGFLKEAGQKAPRDMGALIRAILESMVWNWKMELQNTSELTGRDFKRICLVGGGIRNTLLCQMVADATGLEVLAGPAEATVIGNILAQMNGAGLVSQDQSLQEFVRQSIHLKRYKPREAGGWEKNYRNFLNFFTQTRNI